MLRNNAVRETRQTGPGKLGVPPAQLGKTNITKNTYRNNAYLNYNSLPSVIQAIKGPNLFRKRLMRYLKNNNDLPTNYSKHLNCADRYSYTNIN
jgi:hypothetical protein